MRINRLSLHSDIFPLRPAESTFFSNSIFNTVFYYLGIFYFSITLLYVIFGLTQGRIFFPDNAGSFMVYLHRSVQMEECFLQDCPALEDIKKQVSAPGSKLTVEGLEIYTLFFPLHNNLYNFLIWTTKRLTSWSWIESQKAIQIVGVVVVILGMSMWLKALIGPASAGLALILIPELHYRLGEPGVLYINPNAICNGLSFLFWAILIYHRNRVRWWWLTLMVLSQISMHPAGYGLAGITLGAYVLLSQKPFHPRTILNASAGAVSLVAYYSISLIVDRPAFWNLNENRSIMPKGHSGLGFHTANIDVIFNLISRWADLVSINWITLLAVTMAALLFFNSKLRQSFKALSILMLAVPTLAMIGQLYVSASKDYFWFRIQKDWQILFSMHWFFLAAGILILVVWFPIKWKKDELTVFFVLFSGLLAVSTFLTNYNEIPSRFWNPMSILLTGAASFILLWLAELAMRMYAAMATGSVESCTNRDGRIWINPLTPIVAVGLIVGLQIVQTVLLNKTQKIPSLREHTLEHARRANYPFDPDQPALLKQSDFPCDKVIYYDHEIFNGDGNWMLPYAYFMYGAMDCGAILSGAVRPVDNKEAKQFYNENHNKITHAVFLNLPFSNQRFLSIKDDRITFRFWKEVNQHPMHILFQNPGAVEAVVSLKSVQGKGAPKELTQLVIPAMVKTWVEVPLPFSADEQRFLLVMKTGDDVWLEGIRMGNESGTTLLWPWNQGVELSFFSSVLQNGKHYHAARRTTRFTLLEYTHDATLDGEIIADQGMSALARIHPHD
ncbi:MAG: hypothetical protein HQL73_03725 [Magnetococcales bacterium]|nr:hypothetical protein [Magnetococcales bacterium]